VLLLLLVLVLVLVPVPVPLVVLVLLAWSRCRASVLTGRDCGGVDTRGSHAARLSRACCAEPLPWPYWTAKHRLLLRVRRELGGG